MVVFKLKSKSEARYKIGMGIGWGTFFFLEGFSLWSKYQRLTYFSTSASMQHMQTADEVIIPSSVPGRSPCVPEWESGPSQQAGIFTGK